MIILSQKSKLVIQNLKMFQHHFRWGVFKSLLWILSFCSIWQI